MLSERENYIRTVRRTGPEWIPASVHILDGVWYELGEALEEVVLRHPLIFPGYRKGQKDFKRWKPDRMHGQTERDPWGVLWSFEYDGIEGQAIEHPLADWTALAGYQAPDPMRHSDREFDCYDWEAFKRSTAEKKAAGTLVKGGLVHGYFLMRLWYLRGFENLMLDVATDEPKLRELCEIVTARNEVIVRQLIDAGVDAIYFGEDIGTQTASILSPADFRKWVVPAYKRLMGPAKEAGIIIDTHSDGYIMELVDDLLSCGCDVLNPQDLCNGIDEIARAMKGRCCIKLDVDRQRIVPFGTPAEIRDLIAEEVRELGSPEGGLSFMCGICPPTPPENIDAVCGALEEFRTYFWDGRGG